MVSLYLQVHLHQLHHQQVDKSNHSDGSSSDSCACKHLICQSLNSYYLLVDTFVILQYLFVFFLPGVHLQYTHQVLVCEHGTVQIILYDKSNHILPASRLILLFQYKRSVINISNYSKFQTNAEK